MVIIYWDRGVKLDTSQSYTTQSLVVTIEYVYILWLQKACQPIVAEPLWYTASKSHNNAICALRQFKGE